MLSRKSKKNYHQKMPTLLIGMSEGEWFTYDQPDAIEKKKKKKNNNNNKRRSRRMKKS